MEKSKLELNLSFLNNLTNENSINDGQTPDFC